MFSIIMYPHVFDPSPNIALFKDSYHVRILFILEHYITFYRNFISKNFATYLQLKPWRHYVNKARKMTSQSIWTLENAEGYIRASNEFSFGLFGYLYLVNARGSWRINYNIVWYHIQYSIIPYNFVLCSLIKI